MADAIICTSGDYALNLNGETVAVTARTYHLARATSRTDANATLTLLPGNWVAAATQSEPGHQPGDTLRTLVRHVASLHGPLRVAKENNVPGTLEGIVLSADSDDVSYGPPESRDSDITHHRTR